MPAAAVTPGTVSLTDWIEAGPAMPATVCGTFGARLTWPPTAVLPAVLIGSAPAFCHSCRSAAVDWPGDQVVIGVPGGKVS